MGIRAPQRVDLSTRGRSGAIVPIVGNAVAVTVGVAPLIGAGPTRRVAHRTDATAHLDAGRDGDVLMNEGEGVFGVTCFARFFVRGGHLGPQEVHAEGGQPDDGHTVTCFTGDVVLSRHGHLVVFLVGNTHEIGHAHGVVPEIIDAPHRCRLGVRCGSVGKLETGEARRIQHVPVSIVGVSSHVPAHTGGVPLHIVTCVDFQDIRTATGLGHGGVHRDAVDSTQFGFRFAQEDGVSGFCWIARVVMRVFFVPNGHGHTVTGCVREGQQQGLPGLKPNREPIVFVAPHVDGPTYDVPRVDRLA